MTTFELPHDGLRIPPLGRLRAVPPTSPGRRADALRDAGAGLRSRFQDYAPVRSIGSVAVATVPAPARLLLAGPAAASGAWLQLTARMLVVRFEDFDGTARTLVWEPLLADAIAAAPLIAGRTAGRMSGALVSRRLARQRCTIEDGLRRFGLEPGEVDFVGFGDLRGHDLRRIAGTARPLANAHQPRTPLFGAARLLLQDSELEAVAAPHPLQANSYVPSSTEDLIEDRLVRLDGDVELGPGVALVATPGITPGHQSLVLRGRDGVWVVSGNGVAVDCWQPFLSKIPGVRRTADAEGLEVVLPAAGAEDPLELYDSMVLERSLADASRGDPRWLQIMPRRELSRRLRHWPVVPTFSHDAL